jgi:hypothetical protein
MKSRLIGNGILAIMLVFGFFVVGCPTDSDNQEENNMTKFEGTWRNPSGDHPAYIFVGDAYSSANSYRGLSEGTFTFTDSTITFLPDDGDSWTQDYTLEGNNLTIAKDDVHSFGVFVKNWEPPVTKFEGRWRNPYGSHPTYVFTNDSYTFSNDGGSSEQGMFVFSDTTITFNPLGGESRTQGYTWEGTKFTLVQIPNFSFYGPFEKEN